MRSWQSLLERAAGHPLIRRLARIEPMTLAAVILAAGLLLAFAQLANAVGRGSTRAFDEWLITALRTPGDLADPIGPAWLEEMMRDFTALGSTGVLTVMVAAIAGFLAMTRKGHAALFVLASVAGGVLISQTMKWTFARPRPELVPHGAEVFTASFPSGHSMMAAIVYLTLGALVARTQHDRAVKAYVLSVAVMLTVLVGASRVYLGVHWPTDVLAGWALGGLWALVCVMVMQWLQGRGQVEDGANGGRARASNNKARSDMASVEVNGRGYRLPERPTVVVCFDGCDPEYIRRGLADGILPTIAGLAERGFVGEALAAVPTFTNPNNASIVTGVPPAVHGISGNYYLDRATGEERMITDAAMMRCGTILAAMAEAGVRTAAVTAKDKLRLMLARGLAGINFSSEKADRATLAGNGIADVEAMVGRARPDQYSADLSLFVLDAGVKLLERSAAGLLYLSLSDFVQHAHAPGTPEADAFNRAVDARLGQLIALGATVGVVADHGMNDKCGPDGTPNVVFLEEELAQRFGEDAVRVICPITDPFVRHHGALGSFVRVYLRKATDLAALMKASAALPGVQAVLDGPAAASLYGLPPELEGDFVVLGDAGTVIGASRAEHDLEGLAGHRLRSHGGLGEQTVPFIVSRKLRPDYLAAKAGGLRNFDIFDAVLNGT